MIQFAFKFLILGLMQLAVVFFVHAVEPKYITVLNDEKNTIWYRDDVVYKQENVGLVVMNLTKENGRASVINIEFNCKSKKWIANYGSFLDKDGAIIYEQKKRDETWAQVNSGSVYEVIFKRVCK